MPKNYGNMSMGVDVFTLVHNRIVNVKFTTVLTSGEAVMIEGIPH